MANQFFDKKKKGQELKQNNIENTYVTSHEQGQQKSRGFLECAIFQLIGFFTVKGNLFSFIARIRIPTVLRGHQCNYTETVPMYRQGKPPSFSTYSCERLNFPLSKLDHIR